MRSSSASPAGSRRWHARSSARRLAHSGNAPFNCIRQLARDASIEIAGPVLRHSARLDVKTLIAIARSKSQPHLLAISKRETVTEPVTDVLGRHRRSGHHYFAGQECRPAIFRFRLPAPDRTIRARFHPLETLGNRIDIPRHIFQQPIAKASDDVRRKLQGQRPEAAIEVQQMVADATGELHSIFGPASKTYFAARKALSALHRCGGLSERRIFDDAQAHAFPEVTIGLSLLCALPANVIERGLADPTGEMPIIFAKALDFSWETTMSLSCFSVAPDHKIPAGALDELKTKFCRVTAETAQGIIRLYRSRKAGHR